MTKITLNNIGRNALELKTGSRFIPNPLNPQIGTTEFMFTRLEAKSYKTIDFSGTVDDFINLSGASNFIADGSLVVGDFSDSKKTNMAVDFDESRVNLDGSGSAKFGENVINLGTNPNNPSQKNESQNDKLLEQAQHNVKNCEAEVARASEKLSSSTGEAKDFAQEQLKTAKKALSESKKMLKATKQAVKA